MKLSSLLNLFIYLLNFHCYLCFTLLTIQIHYTFFRSHFSYIIKLNIKLIVQHTKKDKSEREKSIIFRILKCHANY